MTRRRPAALLAAALVTAIAVVLPAVPASAAASTGWLRLAHLSPDTKEVDITLSSLSGGTVLYRLTEIGYGDVSNYIRLPEGTYALAMVPAGAPASSTPVLSGSVEVTAGEADTLVALGRNADLSTKLFDDELDDPGDGEARVRVVQASVEQDSVDVAAGSTEIAKGAGFGTASDYTTLEAGDTEVELVAGGDTTTETVDLPAGTTHTLFVLDTADGGLTVSAILDSRATAVTPTGGVAAGGGALARGADEAGLVAPFALGAALAAAVAVAALLRRPARAS